MALLILIQNNNESKDSATNAHVKMDEKSIQIFSWMEKDKKREQKILFIYLFVTMNVSPAHDNCFNENQIKTHLMK